MQSPVQKGADQDNNQFAQTSQTVQQKANPGAKSTKQSAKGSIQAKQRPIQAKQKSVQAKQRPIQAKQQIVQRNTESTGPGGGNINEAQVKANVSALMGTDVSNAQVNYNSSKPAQLQAEATAQGNQVDLAPGKEQHLGHELTHVAQQKQGRVKPTIQANNGVGINDDPKLEKEADDIGAQAQSSSMKAPVQQKANSSGQTLNNANQPAQLFPQKGIVSVSAARVQAGRARAKVHKSNIKDVDGRGTRHFGQRATEVTVGKTKATLNNNTEIKIDYDMMDTTGNYVWVQYASGGNQKIGYVNKNHVTITDPELYKHKDAFDAQDPDKQLIAEYQDFDHDTPLFPIAPDVTHVRQGQLGDCYFVTAVSSLVQRDASKITEMMDDKGAYVEVKFYNNEGKRSTVRVSKSVVKYGNGTHAIVGTDAYTRGSLWIQVLEKAYATFRGLSYTDIQDGVVGEVWKHLVNVDFTHDKNEVNQISHYGGLQELFNHRNNQELLQKVFGSDMDAWKSYADFSKNQSMGRITDYGGFVRFFANDTLDDRIAAKALTYLSEHYSYIGEGKYTDDEIQVFNKIDLATQNGEMVAAGTPEMWYQYGEWIHDKNEGAVGHHYYSVFSAHHDEATGRRYFTVRNPWGVGGIEYQQDNVDGLEKDRYVPSNDLDMDAANNGVFEMDLAHFLRTMDVIMYSSGMDHL